MSYVGLAYWQKQRILVAALLGLRFKNFRLWDVAPQNKKEAEQTINIFLEHGDPSIMTPEELSYIEFICDTIEY